MLTRPYYKGTVIYKGVAYKGTHERLVQPEVWYQVQTVLRNHVSAMERTQKHTHYLKGSLYCGQCGSRLTVANARSKTGVIYPYFVCVGRHSGRKPCTRSAVPIPRIERMVENYYAHLQIPEDTQATIREQVSGEFDRQLANGKTEMDELLVRQREIEEQQEKRLDAHLAGAVPLDLMRKRQTAMELDLQHITSRLESMHKDYSDAKQHLEDCLRLLGNCHDMYRNYDDQNRRLCNQAFFKRIYIDADAEMQVDLAQPFTLLTSPSIRSKRMEAVKEKTDGGLSASIQAVKGLNISTGVDAMEHYGNRRPRVERLVSAWDQGIRADAESKDGADDPLIGASAEPKKRPRTRLTDEEVDAMRTAREQGVSVNALARRFGVHRGTVWAKTR